MKILRNENTIAGRRCSRTRNSGNKRSAGVKRDWGFDAPPFSCLCCFCFFARAPTTQRTALLGLGCLVAAENGQLSSAGCVVASGDRGLSSVSVLGTRK